MTLPPVRAVDVRTQPLTIVNFAKSRRLFWIWHIGLAMGLGFAWKTLWCGRRFLAATTLRSAWNWSLLGLLCLTCVWAGDVCQLLSPAAADHAWYACAVLGLCPPIAVLGARRPGVRVWTWFIVGPMLLTLSWPILALALQGTTLHRLQLETPQLAAFCLVLVMGYGNYCGTLYTVPALLSGGALLGIALESSADFSWLTPAHSLTRLLSSLLMVVAVLLIGKSVRPVVKAPLDRIWFDFFDTFGIVWGRRIQDRVNFLAAKEKWPYRLELEGFVPVASVSVQSNPAVSVTVDVAPMADRTMPTSHTAVRIEQILRWLLRRFVDPAWIDERLEHSAVEPIKSAPGVDS